MKTLDEIQKKLFPNNPHPNHGFYLNLTFNNLTTEQQKRFLNAFGQNFELIDIWEKRTKKPAGYFLLNQVIKQLISSPTAPSLNYNLIPVLDQIPTKEQIFSLKTFQNIYNDFAFANLFKTEQFGKFIGYRNNKQTEFNKIYAPKLETFFSFLDPNDPYILDYVYFQSKNIKFENFPTENAKLFNARKNFLLLKIDDHFKKINPKSTIDPLLDFKYSFLNKKYPISIPNHYLLKNNDEKSLILTNFRATPWDLSTPETTAATIKDYVQYLEIWKLIELYTMKQFAKLQKTDLQIATFSNNNYWNIFKIDDFFDKDYSFSISQDKQIFKIINPNKTFLNSKKYLDYMLNFIKKYYERYPEIIYYKEGEFLTQNINEMDINNWELTKIPNQSILDIKFQQIQIEQSLNLPLNWDLQNFVQFFDGNFGEQFNLNILPTGSQINEFNYAFSLFQDPTQNAKLTSSLAKYLKTKLGFENIDSKQLKQYLTSLSLEKFKEITAFQTILQKKFNQKYDVLQNNYQPLPAINENQKILFEFGHFMEPILLDIFKTQLEDESIALKYFGVPKVQLVTDKRTMLFKNIFTEENSDLLQVVDIDGLIIDPDTKKILSIVECKTSSSNGKQMSNSYAKQATLYSLLFNTNSVIFLSSQMPRFGNQGKIEFNIEKMFLTEELINNLKEDFLLWQQISMKISQGINPITQQEDNGLKVIYRGAIKNGMLVDFNYDIDKLKQHQHQNKILKINKKI